MIPHDQIKPYNKQPRTYIDPQGVIELADSIEEGGQNTPVIVTQRPTESFYTLIGGERRWQACGILCERQGMVFDMKAVIEPWESEEILFGKAFIDNLHRADMPPLDVSAGFKRLLDSGKKVEEIAKLYGRSNKTVYDYLALNDLDDRVKALMNPELGKKALGITQAITLTKIPNADLQFTLAEEVVASKMSDADLNIAMVQQADERGIKLTRPAKKPRRPIDQLRVLHTFTKNTERWLDREIQSMDVEAMYSNQDDTQVEYDIDAVNRILTKMRKLKARLSEVLWGIMRVVSNSNYVKRILRGRHEVYLTEDDADLMDWHDPDEFKCIIVDVDKTHGVYAPRALREENSIPIIGISAELPDGGDWFEQRAIFIEQGGTYLLQAPINPREMLACLMSINRASLNVRPLQRLANKRLIINISQRVVLFDGKYLPFTGKENALFLELAAHIGGVRTKENLLSALYSLQAYDEPEIKIIDVFVCKIRKKLDEAWPGLGSCVVTAWGQGYKLIDLPDISELPSD